LRVKLRNYHGVGDGLSLAKNLRTSHADLELEVLDGEFAGRRLWETVTLAVDDSPSSPDMPLDAETLKKYQTAVRIGKSKVRALIESAFAILPNDVSERGREFRKRDVPQLDGLEFWGRVIVKKGTAGYSDKNALYYAVTPDMKEWPDVGPSTQSRPSTAPSLPAPAREEFNDEIPF
jgi:hypothetical protein